MSYSSDITKERILDCAKAEFIAQGFLKANMRTIAQKAKVTTGALYNHFKNKELLFEAIVSETAIGLLTLFQEEHELAKNEPFFFDKACEEEYSQGFFKVFDYIYDNFEQMQLLICHSTGTKYESYIEELIHLEEVSTLYMLEKEGYPLGEINRFFVHVVSSSMMNNMCETIRHNLSREQAEQYSKTFRDFYFAGFKEILGL